MDILKYNYLFTPTGGVTHPNLISLTILYLVRPNCGKNAYTGVAAISKGVCAMFKNPN